MSNRRGEDDFYKKVKGKFLYKQIETALTNYTGIEITSEDVSSLIRYDKSLRDQLYIYLATMEEYLRAQVLDKYDLKEEINICDKRGRLLDNFKTNMNDYLQASNDTDSKLYSKLKCDLGGLIIIIEGLNFPDIDVRELKNVKKLRNDVMHHSVLLLKYDVEKVKIENNLRELEIQMKSLVNLLPDRYVDGFLTNINCKCGRRHSKYVKLPIIE